MCSRAERRAGLQLLDADVQLGFQVSKPFFKPALTGSHHPIVNEEDHANEREHIDKKSVTDVPM